MSSNGARFLIFNSQLKRLYESAHLLLHLGEDGVPIYADQFRQLNARVFRLIHAVYSADVFSAGNFSSDEQEAELCLVLLMGFSATIYNVEGQEEKLQIVLDRIVELFPKLEPSLLKCRLLLYAYGTVQEKVLLDEAKEIIMSWGGRELTEEEKEMMRMWNGMIGF